MSSKSKLTTSTELTSTGFIREFSRQIRGKFTIELLDSLDPYPDAYKVFMRKVTVKKTRQAKGKNSIDFLIARPMEGHMPTGGYDVLFPDGTNERFNLFANAKHIVDLKSESWLSEQIDAGGFLE
jgi:hypothetical protein